MLEASRVFIRCSPVRARRPVNRRSSYRPGVGVSCRGGGGASGVSIGTCGDIIAGKGGMGAGSKLSNGGC
jgi:hypothetical protein